MTKAILEAVTSPACDIMDLNSLQVKFKKSLIGKKFLIFLDDVWNESYDAWDVLRKPFKEGAQGSKITVTTRSQKVACVMGTVETYYLKELMQEDC